MSEARLAKVAATRALYKLFDESLVAYITRQATTLEAPGTEAFGLAGKVIECIDRLAPSLQPQFARRRAMAEDFLFVYGPAKPAPLPSPEFVQDLHDQVCSAGKYSPF